MDAGFSNLDINSVPIKSSDNIFLMRFPKTVNVKDFDGVSFRLQKGEKIKVETSNKRKYELSIDDSASEKVFRPLLTQSSSLSVGPEFSATITVTDQITTSDFFQPDVSDLPSLLPEQAYCGKQQLTNLQVRFVPIGSLSTVKQIEERKGTRKAETNPEKAKKAKSVKIDQQQNQVRIFDNQKGLANSSVNETSIEKSEKDKKKKKRKDGH